MTRRSWRAKAVVPVIPVIPVSFQRSSPPASVGTLLANVGVQKEVPMSLLVILVAIAIFLSALYVAVGEVQSRLQSQRLTRELVRAFHE